MPSNISAGNSLATATSLTLNSSNLQITGSSVNVSASASDFYTFRLPASSSLNFSLANLTPAPNGNVNFEVLASNGTTVVSRSANAGTLSESINLFNQAAGTYYLRVYTDTTSSASYTLNLVSQTTVRSDLVWRNYGTGADGGKSLFWTMNGTNAVASQEISPVVSDKNWQIVGTGDFNRDGQTDLVWRNYGATGPDSGKTLIWTMNGNTALQSQVILPAVPDLNWKIVGTGEFNGDGQVDLVWRNYGATGPDSGKTLIWTMNGTTAGQSLLISPAVPDLGWQIVGTGEFNGDGQTDLVWRNYGTGPDSGKTLIWTMNGTTAGQSLLISPAVPDLNWKIVGTGDFNGDGQTDLVWRNYGATGPDSAKTLIWTMNGTTALQSQLIAPSVPDTNWQIQAVRPRYETPPRIDIDGNTPATAFSIGTLNGSGTYLNFVGGSDGSDYYSFSVNQSVTLDLTLSGLTDNVDVEILNSNGDPLDILSDNPGTQTETLNAVLASGSYLIRVYSVSGSSTYNLDLDVTANGIDLRGKVFDIVPTTIALPQPPAVGQAAPAVPAFNIQYQIENVGTLSAGTFKVSFYLSPDNTFNLVGPPPATAGQLVSGTDLFYLGGDTVSGLTAGQVFSGTRTVTNLPPADSSYWSSDRTYYIGIVVDDGGSGAVSGGDVLEASESNNYNLNPAATAGVLFDGVGITGTLAYDIAGATFTGPTALTVNSSGGTANITFQLRNLGRGVFQSTVGGPRTLPIGFYLSRDTVIGDSSDLVLEENDFQIQLGAVGTSNATSSVINYSLLLPPRTSPAWTGTGVYYLGLYLDPGNLLGENISGRPNNRNQGSGIDFIPVTITFS